MSYSRPTAIKLKVIKVDGTSELRRLTFAPNYGSESRKSLFVYQSALCSSVLKSLGDMYPELPVGSFNDRVAFTVKDEDGDMVSFSSIEEFAQVMSTVECGKLFHAGVPETMRLEVTVLKNTPVSVGVASPAASSRDATAPTAAEPASSDNGSNIGGSFVGDMSRASSAGSSSQPLRVSYSVFPAAPPSPPPSPAVSTASARSKGSTTGSVNAPSTSHPTVIEVNHDPAAPARAFLTQVLPGLADVLARSMYTAQWMPQILSNGNIVPPVGAPSVSPSAQQRSSGDAGVAAAAGMAAAAVTAAATTVDVAAAVHSAALDVATAVSSACAAPPSAVPPAASLVSPTASASKPAASTADAPVVHTGVRCDGCDMCPITGTRYKCAVRSDFDLCEACEAGVGADSPFPFLKIRTPAHAPAAIVCLLKPDQPGSVEEAASKGPTRGRAYGMGQARAPQRAGWGEGRRNSQRWMRDLARRQWMGAAASGDSSGGCGGGFVPHGVDVVHGAPQPWRGCRMQRRMQESGASAAQKAEDSTKTEDPPTRPASVSDSTSVDEQLVAVDPAKPTMTRPTETIDNEADKTVATLTASAVAEASQSAEYQDMLAASMRSLASSMNASLPVSTVPQDNKPRASTASGDVKPQGKPMARFVTDVSVADGSPLPPNTRFVKTWCMRNDGTVTFPPGCRLMPVGGDLMGGPEEGVTVEQRAPGEEFHVSVTLTTPPLSGRYIGYWRLRTAEGQNFGHRIWADVLVTGGTADLVTEGSLDGDWDLVNMQRLSKAVEDTAKDAENVAADAVAAAAAAAANTPASSTPVETTVADSTADVNTAAMSSSPGGYEETKASDDEGDKAATPASTIAAVPAVSAPAPAPGPAAKWHRELCSLAEMGFEDTARNIALLEKHVTASGSGGMERVLHELLSQHEVFFQ